MTIRPLLAILITLATYGCGAGTGETTASAAEKQSADTQQPEFMDGGGESLVISPRTYTEGTVKVKVVGFFEVDGTQTVNVTASLSDEEQTWLQFGVSGGPGLDVMFTNSQSMAEHGVTIGLGPYSVTTTSTSGECQTQVDVKPTLITGRYSCSGSTGYNKQTRQMGKVDVEVEFSAGS